MVFLLLIDTLMSTLQYSYNLNHTLRTITIAKTCQASRSTVPHTCPNMSGAHFKLNGALELSVQPDKSVEYIGMEPAHTVEYVR